MPGDQYTSAPSPLWEQAAELLADWDDTPTPVHELVVDRRLG
jgi:hypothetical protein